MKNNKKLSPDIVLKKYWENKERFADLFNAVIFNGKNVIKKEELEQEPTEVSNIVEGAKEAFTLPRMRDVVMRYHNITLSVLCMENERKIHYAMPLRKMLYDGLSYQKQCDSIANEHKRKKDLNSKEFLSFMTKEDRLYPVITIVVYYGEEEWDGAKSLYEMLDIPEDMKPFVNDYKINLVEIKENNLKLHDEDNSQLFEYISIMFNKNYTAKEKRIKLLESDKAKSINKEVLMALAAATDTFDRLYYKKIIENRSKEGVISMNEVFDELVEEGRKKGIREGREEGRKEGKEEGMIYAYYEMNLSSNEIAKKVQLTEKEVLEILDKMKK